MGYGDGLKNSSQRGVIPLGFIEHRCEVDKYGNAVSIIRLADGSVFRMVHNSPAYQPLQRATIFAGRGKSVKLRSLVPSSDTQPTWIRVAEYKMEWCDGEPGEGEDNPLGPSLKDALRQTNEDFDTFIVYVLTNIEFVDACWLFKSVKG